ncbi:acylphosphatase [Methanothrix thermoacetophila]|nr:acylphosphatase [Methanothrix thermoacetophila]
MKVRALIRGQRVHGVGYRNHLFSEADSLCMDGFSARNLRENGLQLVEVLFEGDDRQVSSFMAFIRSSWPKAAEVSEISFEEYDGRVEKLTRFAIRFQAIQLSKGVESILRIEAKQDQMLEKQDRMLEKQDQMLGKQDLMLEKQDETVEEFRGVRSDLKEHMEKRFARIEGEIAEIKRVIRELGGSCV